MTQNPRNEIEKLLGTAILRNDKNYTNDIMAVIAEHYISKDEILKARPALKPVDWNDISTPELIAKQSEAYGRNEALKDWSKALGIGE